MLSVLLLCVIFCACAALAWRAHARNLSAHPLPPALSGGVPLLGHTLLIAGDTTGVWPGLMKTSKECMRNGGVMCTRIGTQLYYMVTDPDDALTVANTCMEKHFFYSYAKNWLGEGLFTSSGEVWRRHRKLLNPAFGLPVIYNFIVVFNHTSRQLVNELRSQAGKGTFEHTSFIRFTAFQSFSKTAFGIDDANVKDFARKYMESSDQLMNLVIQRYRYFWLHSNLIFKLCGLKKKEECLIEILNDMANQVIERKKEDMKKLDNNNNEKWSSTSKRCKPLMSLLMELNSNEILTKKEIKEEVDTAIVAGFDTTANTLILVIALLGSYPDVQQKMYEEIIQVVGPERDIEKRDVQRLVYTEAVIKETLRVFPIGPALLRYVDKDVKLRNFTMRAGSQCMILPLGTHKDPLWGDDVEVFRPERWLDPTIAATCNSAFYGFSLGKRSCIGKTYAMVSMKVTLSHLLRRFKISSNVKKIRFKVDIILKPTTAPISLEYRN